MGGKLACRIGVAFATRHTPRTSVTSARQRHANGVAGILAIGVSAACVEGPRAVAVAVLELDNGPVNLVKAILLHESIAIDGDYTTITVTNAALPAVQLQARGTKGT